MTAPLRHDPDLGFCRFRIPLGGRRAIWEVTNACNYGCRYCIFGSTSRTPPGELPTARALAVVGELAAAGFGHVKFTGGEPFLRPDMADLLERARALGIACDVSTNASRIDAPLARRLAGLGLDMVHVSLDGPDRASHEAVRGKGAFEPTLAGLAHLVAAGVPVRVGCVVHARNEDLVADTAAFCADLGAGSVVFSRMEPVGRMRGRPSLVTSLDDAAIGARVVEAARLHGARIGVTHNLDGPGGGGCGTCPGGDRFAFIDHRGRVSPCTWVSEHRPHATAEGTLADHTLADLLASTPVTGFRAAAAAFAASGARACPMADPEAFSGAEAAMPPPPGRFGPEAPVYALATENLAYVADIVRPGDRVVTVTGSGDHVIAAAAAGATAVTGFDLNRRARLWTLVKLAALERLGRQPFLDFLLPGPSALAPDTALALSSGLPTDAAAFLRALCAAGSGILEGPLFVGSPARRRRALGNVPYLADDEAYGAARTAVAGTTIVLRDAEAGTVPGSLTDRVDAVLLSNLAEHAHRFLPGDPLTGFRDAVARPFADRLAPGGRLALYVFDAPDRRGSSERTPFGDPSARRAAYGSIPGARIREPAVASALDDAAPGDADAVLVVTRNRHA